MIRIASEKELLEVFRPIERDQVELPLGLEFPMGVKDYLAWTEGAGARVFLVFEEPSTGKALGVVFRCDQSAGDSASMCEWCHAVRAGDGVKLLTAQAASNRRVGISLCRDLSCKDKAQADPGTDDMPLGPTTARERTRRILTRMSIFARRNLF